MERYLLLIILLYFVYILLFMLYMFFKRKGKIKEGIVKISHFRAYIGESNQELTIIQNHFNNQFQVPVVFMIAILFNIQFERANACALILAILFFISRLIHSYIHLGYNNVLHRALVFFFGMLCVFGLLINALI